MTWDLVLQWNFLWQDLKDKKSQRLLNRANQVSGSKFKNKLSIMLITTAQIISKATILELPFICMFLFIRQNARAYSHKYL